MTGTEMNTLYQQMGEVLTGLRCLHEAIEIRRLQAEKQGDVLRGELCNARRETQRVDDKVEAALSSLRSEIADLRQDAASTSRSIDDLALAVHALQRPVAEIVALRGRAAGLLLAIGGIGSAAVWLIEPFYRWIVDDFHFRP